MKHASEFQVPIRNPLPAPDDDDIAKASREAAWVHGFCVAVIDSYAEQEFHKGQRCCYGLTAADVKYAQSVCGWTDHHAEVAAWMGDDVNRYTVSRAASAGVNGLDEAQQARLGSKPKGPAVARPETLRKPPDWPPDPAAPTATADFFAARRPR